MPDRVCRALKGLDVKRNVPLSTLTSFHIGGPAALLLRPKTADELGRAIQACAQFGCPYCVLGNGTNVLAPDAGYAGMIIRLDTPITAPLFIGETVACTAGMPLSIVARESVANGLMGMEALAGIPGSVGGAIAMNAGAYGVEIRHIIKSVRFFENGHVYDLDAKRSDFGYRSSRYSAPNVIVLSARFLLEKDDGSAKERMADYANQRKEKQPLSLPSAGSFFKRPKGRFAGALIESCGLKGVSVGGAQVSPKHAGFLVNTGGATERDVLSLMQLVQERVYAETGVLLEREVRLLSEL